MCKSYQVSGLTLAMAMARALGLRNRDDCGERGELLHKLVDVVSGVPCITLEPPRCGPKVGWNHFRWQLASQLPASRETSLALAELATVSGAFNFPAENTMPIQTRLPL